MLKLVVLFRRMCENFTKLGRIFHSDDKDFSFR